MSAVVNTHQAEAWNGYEGEHWAANQGRWDVVSSDLNEHLLAAARIARTDRVLDIGWAMGSPPGSRPDRRPIERLWESTCPGRCWNGLGGAL